MIGTDPSSVLCQTIPSPDSGICTYDDTAGLTRATVLALAQDESGYLWIGTESGPMRFDGLEWGTPTGLSALHTSDTWAFDTHEPHALWVGTNGAGLWLMDTRSVPYRRRATLTSAEGLADNDVHVLCRDAAHALWVGTHHGLAVVEEQRVSACFTARDGIPEAGICALCADRAGGLWAGSLHGLLRCEDGAPRERLTCQDGLPDEAVYALCVDTADRVWVGTRNGIAVVQDGRVNSVIQDGLPSPEIRALCLDQSGRIWAGTAKGLVLIEQGRVSGCWTRQQSLPSSSVWSLLCDHENRLWVGTEGGLAMLPRHALPVRALPLSVEAEGGAFSFATDRRRHMWIGTASGLVTVAPDGRETTPPGLPAMLARTGVWVAHRDGAGRIWAAGRYGGLYCLDAETGQTIAHIDAVNAVRCLSDDGDGRLWIGTLGTGLACLDMDSGVLLHRLTAAPEAVSDTSSGSRRDNLPSDHVSSLCVDADGRLWVGTLGGGLACVDRRRGTVENVLGSSAGVPHLAISGLALGADNHLWATTQGGGLCRVDVSCDRVSGVWTIADGLPSDTLFSCAFDHEGALWIGTARGLARYLPTTGTCVSLGRPHGMPSEYCQQGALLADEQGQLWVGTAQGVAIVAPRNVPHTVPARTVFLTGLRVMGQEREIIADLEIDEADYDLVVDYGAVTFVDPGRVHYRTQLLGLDSTWSAPQPHRFTRYTNLRPGEYTFRVCARNWGGQWSPPCELPFRVVRNPQAQELAHAWQRAEAAEAAVRARNDVLSTVAHDLRSPLTSIMGHAELLQNRLERAVPGAAPPSPDWLRAQANALRNGARRMCSMVEEILDVAHLQMGRQLVLQIEPVDVGALVQAVAGAKEAGAIHSATLVVDAPPNAMVEGDRARLERVVENLIDNAIKYSPAATPVHARVSPGETEVTISVRDQGVGIPADELPHLFTPFYRASTAQHIPGIGIGLAGAKTIVEQHGGRITVQSAVGAGTLVAITLPYTPPAPLGATEA